MEQPQSEGLELSTLADVLRRSAWLILLCVALAAGGALAYSLVREPEYSATASLLSRGVNLSPNLSPDALGSLLESPQSTPERDAATVLELAGLDAVKKQTAATLRRREMPAAAQAVADIELVPKGESDVIEVTATAREPQVAADTANAFVAEYVDFQRGTLRKKIRASQRLINRELDRLRRERQRLPARGSVGSRSREARQIRIVESRVRLLEARAEDVQILAAVQPGTASVAETAAPSASPSAPKPVKNTAIGGFAGLLIGLALALVRELRDRRLRLSDHLEEAYGLPVLSRVPKSRELHLYRPYGDLPLPAAEAFRMLRVNLRYRTPDQEPRSVLVTSAAVDEGKTTVAFNLAAAAAASGAKALLIEADIRRPMLANRLGLPGDRGLTTLLAGDPAELRDMCHSLPVARQQVDGATAALTMDVLLAGPSQEGGDAWLANTDQMQKILVEAGR